MQFSVPTLWATVTLGAGIAIAASPLYTAAGLNIEAGITAPAAGDFNGDGLTDLVVHMSEQIRIYPGDGKGNFGAPFVTSIGSEETRKFPHAAITGDFNRDNKLDYFAFQRVFLGNGDGSLRLHAVVEIEDRPGLLDVNGDGIPDLTGMSRERFVVVLGTEDGRFCADPPNCNVPWRTFETPRIAVLGDVNLDGKLDLVTGPFEKANSTIESKLSVLEPSSSPETPPPVTSQVAWPFISPAIGIHSIAIGDVTGDGLPDLIVGSAHIFVSPGAGNGAFSRAHAAGWGTRTGYFEVYYDSVVADFDGDGRVDVGYIMRYDEPDDGFEIGILYGDGKGALRSRGWIAEGFGESGAVASGDWNKDGVQDLVWSSGKMLYLALSKAPEDQRDLSR